MDEQMISAVKLLHSSNKHLCERFNDLRIDDRHSDCKEGTEQVKEEVTDLKQRLSAIEDGKNLHEETIQTLKEQLNEIKQRVETLNENLAINNIVSGSDFESEPKPCTTKSKGEEPHLHNNYDTDESTIAHVEASGTIKPHMPVSRNKTLKLDQSRLEWNQASQDTHIRAREEADGGTDDEIMTTRTPEVVKQSVERIFDDGAYWRFIGQQTMDQGKLKFRDLQGVHSVICLDISESMAEGKAWSEALCFLNDYLTGLEDMALVHGLTNEHVALVTFGHETKIQQPFTNKFRDIKRVVNTLRLGGPSPMYGGLILSVAAAGSSEHQVQRTPLGVSRRSKFVVITDGFPTENGLKQGPDIADTSKTDETNASILQLFGQFEMDIFCIPVGNTTNMEFLLMMVEISGGRLLDYQSGKRLSRDYYLHTRLLDALGLFGSEPIVVGDESGISTQDKEDMKHIQQRNKETVGRRQASHSEQYRDSKSEHLPVIGSRVRRGPDWHWAEQDAHGPGTIVGHGQADAHVWVTWDKNGRTNVYQYGKGTYTVLLVDEPRKLEPGQTLAVGCIVKPGTDWKDTANMYNKGVVIEVVERNKAVVQWENGDRNTYTFNGRDGQEIVLRASGFEPFNTGGSVLGYATSVPSTKSETNNPKKKNKNI